MKIIAFDPGKIASYAILDTTSPHRIQVGEVDVVGSGRLVRPCGQHIAELIRDVDCGIVEEVGAMRKQGVSSMFTFGMCVGAILNAIGSHSIPLTLVTPAQWKRSTRIYSASDEEVKTLARAYATELWPEHKQIFRVKKNHGMAEAALMARWYFLKGPGRDAADDDVKEVLMKEPEQAA
jgi:crossover junction endodeoxyribonuclease RuvC